jgi:hypothetical protein
MDHAKFLRAQDVHSLNQGVDVFHLVEGVRLCWARERRLEMSRDESVTRDCFFCWFGHSFGNGGILDVAHMYPQILHPGLVVEGAPTSPKHGLV